MEGLEKSSAPQPLAACPTRKTTPAECALAPRSSCAQGQRKRTQEAEAFSLLSWEGFGHLLLKCLFSSVAGKALTAFLIQAPCEGRPLFLVKGRHPRVSLPTSGSPRLNGQESSRRLGEELSRSTGGFPELELPLLAARAFRTPLGILSFLSAEALTEGAFSQPLLFCRAFSQGLELTFVTLPSPRLSPFY